MDNYNGYNNSNESNNGHYPNDNQVNSNNKKQPKPKKKRGCLRGFLFFLFLIAALIGGLIFWLGGNDDKIEELNDPSLSYDKMISNLSEEELKLDFDDDGLTNEEEIELGTDIFNPDTDGDGIYDGTEVSMYNTDPLKYSTAGDDVSDMAKIDAGLDPFSKFKGKVDNQTINVENTEVSITTNDLNSLSTYIVKEINVNESGNKFLSKPVKVSDFKGTISIPFNSSEASNPAAYYYNEFTKQKLRIRDVEFNDSVANIEIKESKSLPIVIMNSTIDSYASSVDIENVNGKFTIVELNTGLLKRFARLIGESSPELESEKDAIWIFRLGDSKSKLSKEDIKQAYPVIGERSIVYIETKYEKIYNTMVNAVIKGMSLAGDEVFNLGFVSINKYEGSLLSILDGISDRYSKNNNSDGSNTSENKDNVIDDVSNNNRSSLFGKIYDVRTDFKAGEDDFSFKNFGILGRNEDGHCAGYAFVSSLIFNNQGHTIPRINERVSGGVTYKYDLSDPYFDDLFKGKNVNKYNVSSGRVESITDKIVYDLEKMEDNQKKLLDFIEYYWKLYNDTNKTDSFYENEDRRLAIVGNQGVGRLDFTGKDSNIVKMADILENRIKSNKITATNLIQDSGHSINIIGMKTNKVDPNIIDLEVYDNNYPNNIKIEDGKEINISDRLYIRLILKEEKKNILGQKQVMVSEKFFYSPGHPFKDEPGKYGEDERYRDNLDTGSFGFYHNYLSIYDESRYNLYRQ